MIFLTGPHCAGKTTVAEILTLYNFQYIDLGPVLRSKHQKDSPKISFHEWILLKEKQNGKHFTDNLLVEHINKYIKKLIKNHILVRDLIICGNRSFQGIQYITKNTIKPYPYERNIIIWIDADPQILWKRFCAQRKPISFQNFKELLKKDERIGIRTIKKKADYIIFNNYHNIKYLKKEVSKFFFEQLNPSRELGLFNKKLF